MDKFESTIFEHQSSGWPSYPQAPSHLHFCFRLQALAILALSTVVLWTTVSQSTCDARTLTIYTIAADDTSSSEELTRDASWQTPETTKVIDSFNQWFAGRGDNQSSFEELGKFLKAALSSIGQTGHDAIVTNSAERLDIVVDGIALVRPDVRSLKDQLRQPHASTALIDPGFDFDNVTENEFVANHVALFYGRWLAQHQFHDEALACLEKVSLEDVLDPATLLFYRGLMEHQLLKKDACLATVKQLLENQGSIPRRYAVVGQLMLADIEPLKVDSLDEVARLMNDVGRRTGLNRSGKRVRDQEKEVIKKLDKLIEDLENQQQQQQQVSRSAQGPTQPLKTSQIAGGGASGEVRTKRLDEGGHWGDLPPAQRAAALAEMSKDMPPHYRAVIEEYFRRLADTQAP